MSFDPVPQFLRLFSYGLYPVKPDKPQAVYISGEAREGKPPSPLKGEFLKRMMECHVVKKLSF